MDWAGWAPFGLLATTTIIGGGLGAVAAASFGDVGNKKPMIPASLGQA